MSRSFNLGDPVFLAGDPYITGIVTGIESGQIKVWWDYYSKETGKNYKGTVPYEPKNLRHVGDDEKPFNAAKYYEVISGDLNADTLQSET